MTEQPLVGQGFLIIEASQSHSFRHTTLGRTPLDERSARRRDLHLTIHNTHKRQISMPPVGCEPTIPARERPQTHALDRAAAGIGFIMLYGGIILCIYQSVGFLNPFKMASPCENQHQLKITVLVDF
jgi:hypothetical protein